MRSDSSHLSRYHIPPELTIVFLFLLLQVRAAIPAAAERPETPRIDSVVMSEPQPHEHEPAVIWYDDFDDPANQKRYAEQSGLLTEDVRFGDRGRALRMHHPRGGRGQGGRKVFFGDSPVYPAKKVHGSEVFTDIYWRIYVKHPYGWTGGGPAKLSRATSLVPPGWRQAMIAHVWSSGEALTLDPASGVRGSRVVTRKYNDFGNLRWLGNKPASRFPLHSRREAGRWVCVEARARLNTPGQRDGVNQLWIDGRLEAERRNLDWRGGYTGHGINAVFLEAYWNQGSPVDQSRWIDNFVISTEPIGPVRCSRNPIVIKTPYRGPGRQSSWQIEVAEARTRAGKQVVWRAECPGGARQAAIDSRTGRFTGTLKGRQQLDADRRYCVRVRQQGTSGRWSDWSSWHQPFRTVAR